MMLLRSCLVLSVAFTLRSADAFASIPQLPLRARSSVCGITMQHSGKPIDRVDGFGGGFEAIQQVIEKRSKDDWGGGTGTGGASGKISDGPASFEEVKYKSGSFCSSCSK
jgi:hypothetical protein